MAMVYPHLNDCVHVGPRRGVKPADCTCPLWPDEPLHPWRAIRLLVAFLSLTGTSWP